jgi:hypothetical protein
MKLEYLDDISDGGKYPWADPDKLVRLYDFEVPELLSLKKEIKATLIEGDEQLVISEILQCTVLVTDPYCNRTNL